MNRRIKPQKLMVIGKQKVHYFIITWGLFLWIPCIYAFNEQPRAAWYRYYNKQGIANISNSVTPEHIRYGYEALDRNMQVIRRNKPYNVEADLGQSSQRAAQARQREQDLRLKRTYSNTAIAIEKQNQTLSGIKRRITVQQNQLEQLQSDQIMLKRQGIEYLRKGETRIPLHLKNQIHQMDLKIINLKKNISSLQNTYRTTQEYYSKTIERLKTLE